MLQTRPSLNQQTGRATGTAPAYFLVALLVLTALAAPRCGAAPPEPAKKEEPKVTEVPEAIVKKFNLDTYFYKKHLDYKGFAILSSAKVSDEGLLEARYLIDRLLGDRE